MKRVPELDSLRAFAAAVVVLYHAFPFGTFSLGWSAVDLFFVLSGYLITSIILEHHREPGFLRAFYVRRALRIWPVYFVVLGVCLGVNAVSPRGYSVTTLGVVQHLTFTQNIQGTWGSAVPPFVHPFGASWSVAIEEQFYLVWPFLILLFGARIVVPASLALITVFVSARLAGVPINVILGRGDSLAMGCMLAMLLRRSQQLVQAPARLRRLFAAVGTVSGTLLAVYAWRWYGDPAPRWTGGVFVVLGSLYFAVIGLIVLNSGTPALAPLRWPVLRSAGAVSYGLYMFHMPILQYTPLLLRRVGVSSPVALAGFTWACIVLVPIASYVLLEKPILRWKDRIDYSRIARNASIAVPA